MIQLVNTGQSSGGGLTIEPYTTGSLNVSTSSEGAGTYNIPAGAHKVVIQNDGLADITANGETLTPGSTYTFEAYQDPATQTFYLCPAIEIIVPASTGANVFYSVTNPA